MQIYLMVTGAMTLLALAEPWLVVIDFFLLIIPGLLLSLAPTAFLWGCIFLVRWLGRGARKIRGFSRTLTLVSPRPVDKW